MLTCSLRRRTTSCQRSSQSAVPVIERCEHANAELGVPLRIWVSTDGTRLESVAEVEASTDGPDPTGGPVLAQPAVVPPTEVDADGSVVGDLPEG